MPDPVRVSIIIPVHNGGDAFRLCLESTASLNPPADEIIVVADGESDGAWRIAPEFGAAVIRIPVAGGPARARNLGARRAEGDILFFFDADMTLSADAVHRVRDAFAGSSEVAAVFGSYDDAPAAPNFLSQYKNLFHHYVHQHSLAEASTFWAGCGAVRKYVFLNMGGFDERYTNPSIEDIEFGNRLQKAGFRIRLIKDLQAKHLKVWSVGSLLRADIFYRAFPWSRLILRDGGIRNDLNLKIAHRVSAGLVLALVFSAALIPFYPFFAVGSAASVISLIVLNFDLYSFFVRKRGLRFCLMALPWHWLYYLYSGIVFALVAIRYKFTGGVTRRRKVPGT